MTLLDSSILYKDAGYKTTIHGRKDVFLTNIHGPKVVFFIPNIQGRQAQD